jgi:G3E family GTPase
MIPVSVLTGFLGSGKTTLLAHLLRTPEFSRTAVIINEFGEIGLDHDLIEVSDESFIQLQTGCLCCAIRGDLTLTLEDILRRRRAGSVAPFERVVIETSGLADPAPILQALMSDASLASELVLAGVVTTVDAVNAADTLGAHHESVKQVAVADRLVLTKTDLAAGASDALCARLAAINPLAPLLTAEHGQIDPALLFDGGLYDPASKTPDVHRWLGNTSHAHAHQSDRHAADIACFAILREEPLPAATLSLFLEALSHHCGADILRMKGIVNIAEVPERPAVIHGVQHVFHPPAWLERWPGDDRASRLVFITRNVPQRWVEKLLDAIDAEVRG